MTDNRYEWEKWIIELQVMTMCKMHYDENVNIAVAGFSWKNWKRINYPVSFWRGMLVGGFTVMC